MDFNHLAAYRQGCPPGATFASFTGQDRQAALLLAPGVAIWVNEDTQGGLAPFKSSRDELQYQPTRARLGAVVHKKNATALAITAVKNEDQREFAKLAESFKSQYNEGARIGWGGHILGPKSQHKHKKRERAVARELAQRATVA
ncbi:ribosomal_L7Ae domain-containing protein [Haematococcus lacustris]|uniref:Ribosomal_L7Ae domain-containing protein n=1 Tax=Haematococcus lacustris TaxID=44745 RepID=A0A6A0A1R7_HAELA|nr:ribosomal_L7Ae domain-containing protein [Haematococcus lacustris]